MGVAYRAGDEAATRAELTMLADEARLLSRMTPLIPTPVRQGQQIAVEQDGLGRIG